MAKENSKTSNRKEEIQFDENIRQECKICGKTFASNRCLKIHEIRHNGQKFYNCEKCPQTFVFSGDLRKHEKIHSSEKPFNCDTCGISFKTSYELKNHQRIHTGEKPFKCTYCDKSFSIKSPLQDMNQFIQEKKSYINVKLVKRALQKSTISKFMNNFIAVIEKSIHVPFVKNHT